MHYMIVYVSFSILLIVVVKKLLIIFYLDMLAREDKKNSHYKVTIHIF